MSPLRPCSNTSPLLVLARMDRLDLLGDAAAVVLTRAVLEEVRDKSDDATVRIEALARAAHVVDTVMDVRVDPLRAPLVRQALHAGLYLDEATLAAALARAGESWP